MPRLAPEMRAIFSAECEDYLSMLAQGFLALEQDPKAKDRLDRMFRAAHSLKGTSRVMGCEDLARAAHGLESLMDRVRQGELILDKARFDALSGVMDGFRRLLVVTLDDGDAAAMADHLLAVLESCATEGELPAQVGMDESSDPPPEPEREAPPQPVAPPEFTRPSVLPRTAPTQGMDVLKVPITRLDAIINQVGELLVTHQRMQGYAARCTDLADQLEDGHRRKGSARQDWSWLGQAGKEAMALAQSLSEEEARMSRLFESLEGAVHRTRMVPLSTLFDQVPKWVRDVGSALGKPVRVEISGADLELDKRMVEGIRDPLLHIVRNGVDHGIESPEVRKARGKPEQGLLRLVARRERGGILITVQDDGAGLDAEVIRTNAVSRGLLDAVEASEVGLDVLARFLLMPGFSTRQAVTEFSGRGVGLDVAAAHLATLKGELGIHSTQGQGCSVSLWVPPSLTSTRVLHVEADGLSLGVPSMAVRLCLGLGPGVVQSLEGRPTVVVDGQPLVLASLKGLLGEASTRDASQAVVLEAGGERIALGVDLLRGELEVLQKPMPARLARLEPFQGISILGDGRIMLLVDAAQLVARARAGWRGQVLASRMLAEPARERSLLLVDDSLTTRVQLRRILEAGGYKVTPAVDGLDAWAKLGTQTFDGVVSDIQMPGMDGLQLTARIRTTPTLAHLPVVLVTTLANEEDQRKGLEAGANAYITKGSFDQEQLLESLRHLV